MAALTLEASPRLADAADPSVFVVSEGEGARLELLVKGARCAGCMAKIEKGLAELPGVASARLNLSTHRLSVRFDPRLTPAVAIPARLAELGYPATAFDAREALGEDDAEGKRLLRCLAVAGFAAANVMLLSISVWAGHGEMDQATRGLFHWLSALIALPAAAFAIRPFLFSALRALRAGRANMDVPISLAVLLALALSLYETVQGGRDAYFDAAVSLLFFLLVGRWLDHLLRRRARRAARDLLALQSTTASRFEADGRLVSVAARDVRPGDRLLIAAGERVPVDVVVEEGRSDVDLSLATGEEAPVAVQIGTRLVSGSINLSAPLVARTLARAEDSFLAELARLIEAGEQAKTAYVRLADRAAALYVPLVHGLAFATFVGWLVLAHDPRAAFINAIALLIVTCPCALGLAVPAVQVVATGRLFRRGVLVKSGDALERLATATHAVLDKTGTLTMPIPRLTNAKALGPALEMAARLARASCHPLAKAVAAAAGPGPTGTNIRELPGAGLEGEVDGHSCRFGSALWLGQRSEAAAETEAFLAIGQAPPIRFCFEASLRPGARRLVKGLAARGFTCELLTGDRPEAAARLAAKLGIAHWAAQATPKDKTGRLDALKANGIRTLMIGDGLNDAPALARAHVSISPGTALEAAQNAADFVTREKDLSPVLEAIDVARAARRRILENFAFAAIYNVLAVPLAAVGLVNPLIAAIAMSSSSLLVTLNALRLAAGRRAS